MKWLSALCLLAITATICRAAPGNMVPECATIQGEETVRSAVTTTDPTTEELLARLAYAEGLSTGFPDDPLIYQAIAWGVMNRVRLGEASARMRRRYGDGVSGVIFRKGQFNPAISRRSRFSREFLCPKAPDRWAMATQAAQTALSGQNNPFLQSPWEKGHGLSLVVNFYYPQSPQARGPLAPWEDSPELVFIGDIGIGDQTLSGERIRFYRLSHPPRDIRPPR